MSILKKDEVLSIEQVAPGELKVSVKRDEESKHLLARRSHDITGALRALRFALEALQSGYKFDDEKRDAKLASMDRALATLEKESEYLKLLFLA